MFLCDGNFTSRGESEGLSLISSCHCPVHEGGIKLAETQQSSSSTAVACTSRGAGG